MPKIIHGDVVIGNFIYQNVRNNNFNIKTSKLTEFNKSMSEKLEEYNYYTRYGFNEIMDFIINYPFFIKNYENNTISIKQYNNVSDRLKRYFRIGIPNLVVNVMEEVYKNMAE